jgi:predicted  nucleic acid-binding Zn-ribbon protein
MNIAFSLFRLQTLDTKIDQINARVNEIQKIIEQDKDVSIALNEKQKAELELKRIKMELDLISDHVTSRQIKLQITNSQLFGGKIKNPKELQDLQQESEALKRNISDLEDDQLDKMILFEQAQLELDNSGKKYNETISRKTSQNARLLGEKSKIDAELPPLLAQRETIIITIPNDAMTMYNQLRRTKGGVAVTKVVDDFCDACGATLTPGDLQSARSPSTLLRCKTCGRILFKN